MSFADLATRSNPAVVFVRTLQSQRHGFRRVLGEGSGSGFVFDPAGRILTNYHVVKGAHAIQIELHDGRALKAEVIGADPLTDVALLRVPAQQLAALPLGDSDVIRVGDWVVAIGNPFGLEHTVSAGIISAKERTNRDVKLGDPDAYYSFLQTDASINPGNSGGPLCDLDGRVLGINTMIVGKGAGIGFAVPSNLARRAAEQILKNGKVERAWIGVGIQDLTPELASALKIDVRAGVLVNKVEEGGPAAKANMKPGDVIAGVGGKHVTDGRELVREVIGHEVGKTVQLEIIRDGKKYGTNMTLTARPGDQVPPLPVQQQAAPQAGLGLSVRDLTAQQSAQLALPPKPATIVTSIVPGSAADRAGLKVGDVVVEADGKADPTAGHLADAAKDGQLLLRIHRRGQTVYVALKK